MTVCRTAIGGGVNMNAQQYKGGHLCLGEHDESDMALVKSVHEGNESTHLVPTGQRQQGNMG